MLSGSGHKESARRLLSETSKNVQAEIFENLERGQAIKRNRKNKSRQTQVKRRARERDIYSIYNMESSFFLKSELNLFQSSPLQLAIDNSTSWKYIPSLRSPIRLR